MKYDLVVCGGGLSGVAASVSAARLGLKVLLIEKSGYLGGAACNNLVNPFMPYDFILNGKTEMISAGIFKEILDKIKELNGLDLKGKILFNEELLKVVLDKFVCDNNVEVLFHSFLFKANREGNKINSIIVVGKSGEIEIEADYFIDTTGDADLSALSNCQYVLGRETDNLCQPMTLCFRIANVDVEKFLEIKPQIQAFYKQQKAEGKIKNPRENILVFLNMLDGVLHFNTTRVLGKNPTNVFDLSKAEMEARAQMLELYLMLKENFEVFKDSILLSSACEIGVRESRKIVGEYTLNVEDLKNCTKFNDGIAACNYDIDIHSPDGGGTSHYYFKENEFYTIPYRCLVPKGIDNLLVAGRCISSTHEAQASHRIMPVCCTLGEAAGVGIGVAFNDGKIKPKDADISKIQKILRENGAFLG